VHLEDSRLQRSGARRLRASCLIYWKQLGCERLSHPARLQKIRAAYLPNGSNRESRCTELDVWAAVRKPSQMARSQPTSARLPSASRNDPLHGGVGSSTLRITLPVHTAKHHGEGLIYIFYYHGLVNLGIGIGPLLTWLYDKFQAVTSVPRSPAYWHRSGRESNAAANLNLNRANSCASRTSIPSVLLAISQT